jgi:hypothetical protein
MSYFTTSEINLYFTHNSAKRTLTLKEINDFIRFWHCVKQPYCILTLSNSWHEWFCFVLYLWEGRNKRYKATKNRKILMTTVPPSRLFEYTRQPIFVSASVHYTFLGVCWSVSVQCFPCKSNIIIFYRVLILVKITLLHEILISQESITSIWNVFFIQSIFNRVNGKIISALM